MANSEIHIPWKGWKIVREIGHGTFGTVYEIERQLLDSTEKAAMKVIRIPRDDDELEQMYFTTGYDNALVRQSIETELKRVEREYALMSKMRGISNIVSCDDFDFVRNEDGIGYTIYIRMQLLKSLNLDIRERRKRGEYFTEEDVIRLGKDISKALAVCDQYNIIHRDIKPQNILVSPLGDYNLGDFGTARNMDHTTQATYAGTISFMAPEVFKREKYGKTVDIYSLGLVMYWLANRYRMPFVPLEGIPTPEILAEAEVKRVSGEPLPKPCGAGEELSRVILKACAYKSEDRYSSASEMYEALCGIETVSQSTQPENEDRHEDYNAELSAPDDAVPEEVMKEKTVGLFSVSEQEPEEESEGTVDMDEIPEEPDAGMYSEPSAESGAAAATEVHERSVSKGRKLKWIIPAVIVALAAALIAVVVLVLPGMKSFTIQKGVLTVADTDSTADLLVQAIAERLELEVAVVNTDQPGAAVSGGEADVLCGLFMKGSTASYEAPKYGVSEPIYYITDEKDHKFGVCLYVNQENTKLLEEITRVIGEMSSDGSLDTLKKQIESADPQTASPAAMITFNSGGGESVSGEMETTFASKLPTCGYSNPGFKFAGWLEKDVTQWADYAESISEFYGENAGFYDSDETLAENAAAMEPDRIHKMIAVWEIDDAAFETSKELHDKVEIEDSGYGFFYIHNNSDVPVDVAMRWTSFMYDEVRDIQEAMTGAIPAGGTGLIVIGDYNGSYVYKNDIQYFVRESKETPIEDRIKTEIKESDGDAMLTITNTSEDTIPVLKVAYIVKLNEELEDGNDLYTKGTAVLAEEMIPGDSIETRLEQSSHGKILGMFIGDQNDPHFYSDYHYVDTNPKEKLKDAETFTEDREKAFRMLNESIFPELYGLGN